MASPITGTCRADTSTYTTRSANPASMISASRAEKGHLDSTATDYARDVSVDPVVAPPPGNRRFPLFDSLRAIAALAVFTTHVGFLTGANLHAWYGPYTARLDVGVAIFFLISGFLLYRPYVFARLHDRRPPRTRDYARRRLLRIVPAYWLALTVLAIYPGLPQMFTDHSWAYYLFLQNYFTAWTLGGITPT